MENLVLKDKVVCKDLAVKGVNKVLLDPLATQDLPDQMVSQDLKDNLVNKDLEVNKD